MRIYQNLGINEREKAIYPNQKFYEEIMSIEGTQFIKNSYRNKNVLNIGLKGESGVASFVLIGKEIYNPFLKETKSKGLSIKRKLSKLEGKEIIASIVKDSLERIIGIRPIRANETFRNKAGIELETNRHINIINHNKLFPKAYFCH